jgi:hypothetical protein
MKTVLKCLLILDTYLTLVEWGGYEILKVNFNDNLSFTDYCNIFVGFEVLTAVIMKASIFWDTAPFSKFKVNWLFGGISRLCLQDWKVIKARNQQAVCIIWFLAGFILQFWIWRWLFVWKVCRLSMYYTESYPRRDNYLLYILLHSFRFNTNIILLIYCIVSNCTISDSSID